MPDEDDDKDDKLVSLDGPLIGDESIPDIIDVEDLLEDEISAEEDFPIDLSLTEEEEEEDDVDVFDDKDE